MTSFPHDGISVTTNRSAILALLCHKDKISRAQIADLTGIPLPTVHRLCAQLRHEGILIENIERGEGRGRPVHQLNFNPFFHAVLSINVRGTNIDGAVMSLNGRILHEESIPYGEEFMNYSNTENHIRHIFTLIGRLRGWAKDKKIPCSGIGIGVPGIVRGDGLVIAANELKWNEVPLLTILNTAFEDQIIVENNANATAYGESLAGAGAGKNPVVGYTMRHFGVGAGIIIDGRILHGHYGMAGEMGYTLTSRESLSKYYTYGGDLEWQISQIKILEGTVNQEDQDYLFDLIALSIGDICLVVDPEIIVMDISRTLPAEKLVDEVRKRLVGRIPHLPEIVLSKLERRAPIIGVGELIGQKIRDVVFNE